MPHSDMAQLKPGIFNSFFTLLLPFSNALPHGDEYYCYLYNDIQQDSTKELHFTLPATVIHSSLKLLEEREDMHEAKMDTRLADDEKQDGLVVKLETLIRKHCVSQGYDENVEHFEERLNCMEAKIEEQTNLLVSLINKLES